MERIGLRRANLLVFAAVVVGVAAFVLLCSSRATALDEADHSGGRERAFEAGQDGNHGAGMGDDPDKQPWEEQIERHEQHNRIAIGIFLGVVFLIFLLWWGWGKLYHRPRKL